MQGAAIDYIIGFLLGDANAGFARHVRYGKQGEPPGEETRVFIYESGFFDEGMYLRPESLPALPLKQVDGLPLLYGDGSSRAEGGVMFTSADLIASAFFLMTRYEEIIRPGQRDQHGRFPGKESLPYQAGFMAVPLVDEYGRLLRGWLRGAGIPAAEPESGFQSIALTHDVDYPWLPFPNQAYLALTLIKGLLKGKKGYRRSFFSHFGPAARQSDYTFPWLIEQDARVKAKYGKACMSIYFLLCCGKSRQDNPYIRKKPKASRTLVELLRASGAEIGLHASYQAGRHPEQLKGEREELAGFTHLDVTRSRHHFLACREPADYHHLIFAGIRDDYSMGYPDVAGFRLGTCRAVKWIDPRDMMVTPLTLHPLTMMEGTLDRKNYMALDEQKAYAYAVGLIDSVRRHKGELTLLWHNPQVSENAMGYQRALYEKLLSYLIGF